MHTHLLDLLSLNWRVEFTTAPDFSIQVTATKTLPQGYAVQAQARLMPHELNDRTLEDFFWRKFFRLCMFKSSYQRQARLRR